MKAEDEVCSCSTNKLNYQQSGNASALKEITYNFQLQMTFLAHNFRYLKHNYNC